MLAWVDSGPSQVETRGQEWQPGARLVCPLMLQSGRKDITESRWFRVSLHHLIRFLYIIVELLEERILFSRFISYLFLCRYALLFNPTPPPSRFDRVVRWFGLE